MRGDKLIAQSQSDSHPTGLLVSDWRERMIIPLALIVTLMALIAVLPPLFSTSSRLVIVLFSISIVLLLASTISKFRYVIRITLFIFGIYVLGISQLLTSGINGISLLLLLGLIVCAVLLTSPKAGLVAMVVVLFTLGIVGWLSSIGVLSFTAATPLQTNGVDWLISSTFTLLFAVLIIYGTNHFLQDNKNAKDKQGDLMRELEKIKSNLETGIRTRTDRLNKILEINRTLNILVDPEVFYQSLVTSIGQAFGCYYSALYLIDPSGRWAELVDATGEAGRVMKENGHRLDVNTNNLIGAVVREKHARIAAPGVDNEYKLDNPLLPYTRSELIVPLLSGSEIIGVLDLHSTKDSTFDESDPELFEELAAQVVIALQNARRFTEIQQNLTELQASQRQYLHNAWAAVATDTPVEFRLGDEQLTENANQMQVPLALRDQIIGQISLASEGEWTPEQRTMIEAIAAQAALALENARLVEDSQATATHERLAVDITSKVWSSPTIDGILQTTVRELGQALGASRAIITLNVGSKDD